MTPETAADPTGPSYNRDAIFDANGPFNPGFIDEAVRTLMRTLPLDPDEPQAWQHRRMHGAMTGLAALNPRDEIEIMLSVQAMAAYHAAAACWYIGMNHHRPNGDSTRHITTAATAARAFDTMLRAIERRQAKPLTPPAGRPPGQDWEDTDPTTLIRAFETRCRQGEHPAEPERDPNQSPVVWTPEDVARVEAFIEMRRIDKENEGLDIANTEGILPGGGMILPEDPTPQQIAYMGRRLRLMYRREYQENLRNGIRKIPEIRPIRPGDLIP
jgi:hypothetical protein